MEIIDTLIWITLSSIFNFNKLNILTVIVLQLKQINVNYASSTIGLI
jgi:hypothetical protein